MKLSVSSGNASLCVLETLDIAPTRSAHNGRLLSPPSAHAHLPCNRCEDALHLSARLNGARMLKNMHYRTHLDFEMVAITR